MSKKPTKNNPNVLNNPTTVSKTRGKKANIIETLSDVKKPRKTKTSAGLNKPNLNNIKISTTAPVKGSKVKIIQKKNPIPKNTISKVLPIFSKNKGKMILDEIGVVISVSDGVAKIIGLKKVQAGEYVIFTSNLTSSPVRGIALNLEREFVLVAIFGNERLIGEGNPVKRGHKLVNVPTGPKLLGRVIDALGNKIDGGPSLKINKKKL